jgi:iron complex outermembrane receptor protein
MGTGLVQRSVIQTCLLTAIWLFPFSVVGQEGEAEAPVPTSAEAAVAPEPVVAPSPTPDQMLAGEFELLQEPIIESASKREESVFASPFSSDVITRDMIQKAGARTIPEALRLLPGMIVREQTSGNFDIHIRGLDNVPPGSLLHDFSSTTVLVMIDYRPVYNYFRGGTFWDTLPVDIVDVERIEVVRGPVAALYGPNAVTGAINIITRKLNRNGPQASARAEGALSSRDTDWKDNFRLGQRVLDGRISYKYNSVAGGASAYYHSFDRLENGLYSFVLGKRVDTPQEIRRVASPNKTIDQPNTVYPEPNLALRAVGVNSFVTYEPTSKLSFVLNGGYQESRTLREYADSLFSPFATHDSQIWYVDLRSHIYDATFQASFSSGHQLLPQGTQELPDRSKREYYEYTFNTLDLNLDYDFVWKWLRARPGVSFRRAEYAGPLFSTWDELNRKVSSSKAIQSASVSLGLEQVFFEKLRFIEAVRLDVYFDRTEHNYYPLADTGITGPITKRGQTLYPSFQFAVTYTPTEDHILRVSYSRASVSPCMMDSFYNDVTFPSLSRLGNNALNLPTLDTVELGYRTRFSQQIDMSIEVFGAYARDFRDMFFHYLDIASFKAVLQFDNLDIRAYQLGSTVSLGFTTRRFNGKVFATLQQTWLMDYVPGIWRVYDLINPLDSSNQKDTQHLGTPDLFGGFYLNYHPIDKLNINLNAYFFSRHTQIRGDIVVGGLEDHFYTSGRVDIQQSFLLNAKVSYNFWNGLAAFVNVRNLFNINQAQFAWGDANHTLCFIGLQFEY